MIPDNAPTAVAPRATKTGAACPSCGSSGPHTEVLRGWDRLLVIREQFSVWECGSCDLAFTMPRIGEEDFARFYPADAYGAYQPLPSDEPRFAAFARRLDIIRSARALRAGPLREVAALPPGRLLDVGCGGGTVSQPFVRRGWAVVGIEPSEEGARIAQARGIDVRVGRVEDTRVEDSSFDAAILIDTLEHLDRPKVALQIVARAVRPGGLLAVSVPNFGCWQSRRFGSAWFHLDLPRHLQHFTAGTLMQLTEGTGCWETSDVRTFSHLNGLPYSLQYAVFGHRVTAASGLVGRAMAIMHRLSKVADLGADGDHVVLVARRTR